MEVRCNQFCDALSLSVCTCLALTVFRVSTVSTVNAYPQNDSEEDDTRTSDRGRLMGPNPMEEADQLYVRRAADKAMAAFHCILHRVFFRETESVQNIQFLDKS